MNDDLLYQIALTSVPMIGDVNIKALIAIFGDAESIFKAPRRQLEHIEGIGRIKAGALKSFKDFSNCEDEMLFLEKYNIQPLFITDLRYPTRLLHCYDSPALLFFKGTAKLNSSKVVSIVGTRKNSEYGNALCDQIIASLQQEDIIIVSGLAFGIDTLAHKAALKYNLSTVGVLAHGLDRIYPSQNKLLAKQMIINGGLLTDFRSGTLPDKQNFPKRNRIVAGMCDALIIVESNAKGGSLITAEFANSYNRDVFAIPGRTTDIKSEGCNYLIKSNKASMITSGNDLLTLMNWKSIEYVKKMQRSLFVEFTPNEKVIVALLQNSDRLHIDEIYAKSGLNSSSVSEVLLMLEMQGVISALPGKLFKMQ